MTTPTRPRKRARGLRRSGKRALMTALGEENFYKTRMYARIYGEQRGKEMLFIHQMGKVGSTTIAASLRAAGVRRDKAVYQTHFLSEAGIAFRRELALAGYGSWDNMTTKGKKGHMRGQMLHDKLVRMRERGDHCQVITLVRDPVATNVSGYFHKNEWWPDNVRDAVRGGRSDMLETLKADFMAAYPHHVPLTWFDMEIKDMFGIDVFATPFPREKGYHIYRTPFADLLLIKLEKLNGVAETAFGEFLNVPQFKLVKTNTAEEKWYADAYDAFKGWLELPEAYLDEQYNSTYARHFYAPEELAAFRGKWARRQPTAA
jgi:hypothetical protein